MLSSAPRSGSRASVLLIDDERELLALLGEGLRQEFDVETAGSAEEGDLMLGTRRYDLIVCDHLMPGEQGLEFLVRAARRAPETKRILLTGYMNPELISRSVAVAELSACLLKPVGAPQLAAAIRAALA